MDPMENETGKPLMSSFNRDPDEWLAQWRENIILFFFAPSWPETAAQASGTDTWNIVPAGCGRH
jgi:hypothetical protein